MWCVFKRSLASVTDGHTWYTTTMQGAMPRGTPRASRGAPVSNAQRGNRIGGSES